jgi:hypothetical protein
VNDGAEHGERAAVQADLREQIAIDDLLFHG